MRFGVDYKNYKLGGGKFVTSLFTCNNVNII